MKTILLITAFLLTIDVSLLFANSNETNNDKIQTQKKVIPKSEKKKDAYPGVEWKPKKDLDKYPGVEWKPKKDKNKYPGVEWKPKEGDPKPHQDANAYPGVEWTPKK